MKDACVVGAGPSGLPTAKALADRGLTFDWFELGSDVGGNWRYGNDSGRSPAYDSLRIDTSKDRMAYADLPMPDEWPTYLPHALVLDYLERYAGRFDLRSHLTPRTEVIRVERDGDVWTVAVRHAPDGDERTARYRSVFVCTGHHWDPNLPRWPGTFTGDLMHSRDFRTPDVFAGARVLVVGIGNSGTDIAVDATTTAAKVVVSTRRGAHVIPRFVLGRPTDHWTDPRTSAVPLGVARVGYRVLLALSRGRQRRYGLPEPRTPLLGEHPTMSQEILPLVARGLIDIRGDVVRVDGRKVQFSDGGADEFDVVVAATGYRIAFPFLDPAVLTVEDNRVDLYKRVVHPGAPGLFFIGLIQPLGAVMPLAEAQARWATAIAAGAPLPGRADMDAEILAHHESVSARYVRSPRHTIQVDYWPYLVDMRNATADAERTLSGG